MNPPHPNRPMIRPLLEKGLTYKQISAELGMSYSTVHKYVVKERAAGRMPPRRLRPTNTLRRLQYQYGVGFGGINEVLHGLSDDHVEALFMLAANHRTGTVAGVLRDAVAAAELPPASDVARGTLEVRFCPPAKPVRLATASGRSRAV